MRIRYKKKLRLEVPKFCETVTLRSMDESTSNFCKGYWGDENTSASVDVPFYKHLLIKDLGKGTSTEAIPRAIKNTGINKDCFVLSNQ